MSERHFPKLYNKQSWRKRSAQQRREYPLCEICESEGRVTLARVAHHIEPHNGDEVSFRLGKLQSLCHACHERAHGRNPPVPYSKEIGADGFPLDPAHPFYKTEAKHR